MSAISETYVVTIGKRPLKMIFKGSVCFRLLRIQFPEAGATMCTIAKESPYTTSTWFTTIFGRFIGVEAPHTTVTILSREMNKM